MNSLEILLSIIIVITFLLWGGNRKRPLLFLIVVQWLLLISQILIYSWRWPMIPLFLLTVFLSIRIRLITFSFHTLTRRLSLTFILIFSILLPSLLFPWHTIPKPTGAYEVGTHSLEIVDHNRVEQWSEGDDSRRLMIQLWYPTESGQHEKKANYHDHPSLFMKEFAEANGIPGFLLQSFVKQKIPATKDSPLLKRDEPYPIIIFSHGFGGNRSQNQFQVLELASHGYIVIGIDHTYYSPGTVFPNGDQPGLAVFQMDDEELELDEYVYEWSSDAQSVLNWVEEINRGEISHSQWVQQLEGRLDLDKVGYLGHSFGGATASHTLAVDNRFKAGINMDGFPYGQAHELGVDQPFLTLLSDKELTANYFEDEEYLDQFYQRIQAISGEENTMAIDGALHFDFSDFPLLSPITSWVGMTGKVSARKQHTLINELTIQFFNEHLSTSY